METTAAAASPSDLQRRDVKERIPSPRPKNGFDRSYRFIGLSCFRI